MFLSLNLFEKLRVGRVDEAVVEPPVLVRYVDVDGLDVVLEDVGVGVDLGVEPRDDDFLAEVGVVKEQEHQDYEAPGAGYNLACNVIELCFNEINVFQWVL